MAIIGTMPGNAYAFGMTMDEVPNSSKLYELECMSADEVVEYVMGGEEPPFSPQVSIFPHHGMLPRVYQSLHRRNLDVFGDSNSLRLHLKHK